MIRVIDGNNFMRRALERDPTGLAPRSIMAQATRDQVWVWDAPDGNARRRAIYPKYKLGRKPASEDIRATIDLVKEVLNHTAAMQITVPSYEADDVIATIARGTSSCHIVSNDRDFLQLGVPCDAKPYEGVEPKYVRLYKTLVGDPADNIPGLKGFGPRAWTMVNKDAVIGLIEGAFYVDYSALHEREAMCLWIMEHLETLRMYWNITGFFDVPLKDIQQFLRPGVPNLTKADALLKEYLL